MTILVQELCDGAVAPAPVTQAPTGNSVFTTVSGPNVFDDVNPLSPGVQSILSGPGPASLRATTSGASNFLSVYGYLTSYHSANWLIGAARLAGVSGADFQLDLSGHVRLRNASVLVATSVGVLPLNAWFRLEWDLLSPTQSFRYYTGANLHTLTPDETISGACTNSNSDDIGFAAFSAGPSLKFTRLIVQDNAPPLPFEPPMFDPIESGTGSLFDRILAGLVSQGFTTGSITDRERARLLAKLDAANPGQWPATRPGFSLYDLYREAGEDPRI